MKEIPSLRLRIHVDSHTGGTFNWFTGGCFDRCISESKLSHQRFMLIIVLYVARDIFSQRDLVCYFFTRGTFWSSVFWFPHTIKDFDGAHRTYILNSNMDISITKTVPRRYFHFVLILRGFWVINSPTPLLLLVDSGSSLPVRWLMRASQRDPRA